jgi:MATE family multidrug resistance protein
VVDGAQAIAIGLLRGVQDTGVPMVMAALSYWAVGIPTSYLLGFVFGLGGIGIWLGLSVGLALAGLLLMLRFWRGAITRVGLVERQDG